MNNLKPKTRHYESNIYSYHLNREDENKAINGKSYSVVNIKKIFNSTHTRHPYLENLIYDDFCRHFLP